MPLSPLAGKPAPASLLVDLAALARAYGVHGETVVHTDDFAPAFERAATAGGPALLHVKIDPQALTMGATLDALRAQAALASDR